MAAHDERAGREELAQAGRDRGRVVRAGPWQQDPELVPTHTGDQAVAPDIGEEDLADDAQDLVADDAQDLVADVVAASVVNAFEVIDIGVTRCADDDLLARATTAAHSRSNDRRLASLVRGSVRAS